MSARPALANPAVMSYYTLRSAVGLIALSLPFALTVGTILLALLGPDHALPRPILQRSISDYYYTPVGNLLVGSLCAIATILICSRGYNLTDEITGYIAGLSTLGLALFPSVNPRSPHHTELEVDIGLAHGAFAGVMFLALAYFCLILFRRTSPERRFTHRKRNRNRVYSVCGLVIIVCNLVMVSFLIPMIHRFLEPFYPLLCCETLVLVAFGIAWLTKGKGFLKHKP
jgi:UDP-N-acetylmuramyl pentapeptide phosphotransferase/UDP-N-acetylglucosamine-1-phosphate transferase